jgi:YegS/Rv2252/BmrU family lipid kinase
VRVALVYNPASGRRRGSALAQRLRTVIVASGRDVALRPTDGPGDAARIAAEVLAEGAETDLFVLGGDGTVNEVVAGAHAVGALTGARPAFRVAVLPGGTTNVVARDLGIPRSAPAAVRALLAGRERAMDLGLATGADGRTRPFVLGCGVGLDAEAARHVSACLKRLIGRHAYAVAALPLAFGRARRLSVSYVRADGTRVDGTEAAWAVTSNTAHYGGPARLSPLASSQDGHLELLLVETTRPGQLLRLGWAATRGDVRACPRVRLETVTSVRVEAEEPAPFHVDAEPAGWTPVSLSVWPGALRMLVP